MFAILVKRTRTLTRSARLSVNIAKLGKFRMTRTQDAMRAVAAHSVALDMRPALHAKRVFTLLLNQLRAYSVNLGISRLANPRNVRPVRSEKSLALVRQYVRSALRVSTLD